MERKTRTFGFPKDLFDKFEDKTKADGMTMTEALKHLMRLYINNDFRFRLIMNNEKNK